jgi:hypothetical protein
VDTSSSVVKFGGAFVLAAMLGTGAWRLMAVSTGDLPVAPERPVVEVAPVEAPPPIDATPRPTPPPAPPADRPDPADYVPPVLNVDDPPLEAGGATREHPGGASEVRSAVEFADADYDAAIALVPKESKVLALQVMDSSRATLDKLNYSASTGQIPVSAALAAVEHQRKVVARRIATLVTPEESARINRALRVGPVDAP